MPPVPGSRPSLAAARSPGVPPAGARRAPTVGELAVAALAALGAVLGAIWAATAADAALPAWLAPALGPGERPALLVPATGELSALVGASAGQFVPDPWAYFARPPFSGGTLEWPEHPAGRFERTFGPLGLRGARDLPGPRPDPLVLLTGDSHLDGVCADDETAAAVLEARLGAEGRPATVLNAACGLYTFPNYLGVVARFAACRPDAVVVVVYGGNDFGALLPFERERDRLPPLERGPLYQERLAAAAAVTPPGAERDGAPSLWQALNQVASFAESPELIDASLERALAYTEAIAEVCARSGSRLLVAYLPPMHDVEPARIEPFHGPVLAALGLERAAAGVTDRLADRYLAALAARRIETLDARPAFRAAGGALYWVRDEHLAVEGQALLGELLHAALAP